MKTLLLTISLLLFGISFSQTTFIVTTTDGQPAVGADVYKSGNVIGKTDENGKFTIERISKGDTLRFLLNLDLNIYTAKTDNPKKNQKISLNLTVMPPAQEQMMEETVYTDNHYETNDEPALVENKLPIQEKTIVYLEVDDAAEFPGGIEAYKSFISSNLQYPNKTLYGKCYVRLIVTEDGSIEDIRVTRGVPDCPECDIEARRLMRIMPKWKPAKIQNKNVKSYVDLPIIFKL